MSRRFVNLAMTDYHNCMFSLHRMDLSKLLFYPTTAEAEAAGSRGGRGRVGKGKPRWSTVAWISSSTVVDGDRIICVSTRPGYIPRYGADALDKDTGTFCFDTVSQEWWKAASDWVLPFDGRAQHVPELDAWLGFSRDHPHHLCAADLSGVAMAPRQAPTLKHVWEDYNPPPMEETNLVLSKDNPFFLLTTTVDWRVTKHFLVNLGSGRFCVAKVVDGGKSVKLSWTFDRTQIEAMGTLTVLTGVEVIRDGGDGELRMVKHKSRQLVHPGLEVACVL